jgi:hypothetical protein
VILKLQTDFLPNFKKAYVVLLSVQLDFSLILFLQEAGYILLVVYCWLIVVSRTGMLTL